MGPGAGSGLGPGAGGGTGGGPFAPGSGIEPPLLLKEVKPAYTDDARKRAIEGDVELEIIVGRDGSVGNVRVTRASAPVSTNVRSRRSGSGASLRRGARSAR